MTELNEIYKCNVCGNIVEVVHASVGQLVCCGQPMQRLEPNTVDASGEKHVPVLEKTEKGIRVRIGSVAHPMEAAHYIEFIEVLSEGKVYRKYLKPGDAPEAEFGISQADFAREYCNLHGLWKS
ncbi:desulfoferrodoxin [Candidatus Woesearchaeota archaeon]|nr:desulfoferrodoxin [Candidatus Woesearchaeota archaeon]